MSALDKVIQSDKPTGDAGWIEYGLMLLWSEAYGYEYVSDLAAAELAQLRADNERLQELAGALAINDALKHREIIKLRTIAEKAERFIRADGRRDPQALYLELRRCFLDDK